MRKLLLTTVVGVLSLWTSGCESLPFLGNGDISTQSSPKATPSSKLEAPESPSPKPTDGAFPDTDISQKSERATDLTRSTDPDERTKFLKQGVQNKTNSQPQTSIPKIPDTKDPFSVLPTIPLPSSKVPDESIFTQLPQVNSQQVPEIPDLPKTELIPPWRPPETTQTRKGPLSSPNSLQSPGVTNLPISPRTEGLPVERIEPSSSSKPQLPSLSSQEVSSLPELPIQPTPPTQWRGPGFSSKPQRQQVPSLPELPIQPTPPTQWRGPGFPPPPPDTAIADGIEVSGVVQVGSLKQIIVKVPTEPTSRYVKIGQRLANGKVLVKRVDLKMGADPTVVFEQSGVEILKEVGNKSKTTKDQ